MMKAERQEQILRKIDANGRVVVTDYAKELGVTEATLRKDLQELDDRGLVQRVHGGAMKPDTELSRFENRVDLGKDVKTKLAAAAMNEIAENRVIFIDGGSTNYLAAQAFPRDYAGTIITNSPAVALWMSDYDNVEVNMLTGTIPTNPRKPSVRRHWRCCSNCIAIWYCSASRRSILRTASPRHIWNPPRPSVR